MKSRLAWYCEMSTVTACSLATMCCISAGALTNPSVLLQKISPSISSIASVVVGVDRNIADALPRQREVLGVRRGNYGAS